MSDYGYEPTLRACAASLRRLGLEYVDLYLLHWPVPSDFETTIAAYRAAGKLLAEGRVRAIGVSNFSLRDLRTLTSRSALRMSSPPTGPKRFTSRTSLSGRTRCTRSPDTIPYNDRRAVTGGGPMR